MKSKIESLRNNTHGPSSGSKGQNKHKWGQNKLRPHNNKEKSLGKKLIVKKTKQDLTKVECFNYDNHGHLAKDYPKPLQASDCISQCKLILQGGFMVEIQAHKAKLPIN